MFGLFIVHKNKMVEQSTKHPNGILVISIQVDEYIAHCPLFTKMLLWHYFATLMDTLSLGFG